jgi:hypothetical protein
MGIFKIAAGAVFEKSAHSGNFQGFRSKLLSDSEKLAVGF